MNFYRVKQFYWAINSRINKKDLHFLHAHLDENELGLFNRLSIQEQKHCINVAYDVEKVCKMKNVDKKLLIKAALLHDIGKTYKKLNVIDKSILVMVDSITKGSIKKFFNVDKVNVYYNHGKIGKDILKSYNYEEKLLYLIENHHNDKITGNVELDILRICDEKN